MKKIVSNTVKQNLQFIFTSNKKSPNTLFFSEEKDARYRNKEFNVIVMKHYPIFYLCSSFNSIHYKLEKILQ